MITPHFSTKNMIFLLLTLALCLCFTLGLATEATFTPIHPIPSDAPTLNEHGLIPADSKETIYWSKNEETGEWTYIDQQIFINIKKFEDVVERERTLIWYETEVKMAPELKFQTQHANPEQIGRRFVMAEDLAKETNSVLAISDDFYGFRVYQKRLPGVIIQDGVILDDETLSKPDYTLPNYDVMARFPDGSLKTYTAGSINAEQLKEQGATDTWCFGPLLITEGEVGEQILEEGFEYANPRQALGMIKPNHYLIVTVEGRHNDSDGVGLIWLAEHMQKLGCTEALNLDGGNSIKLVFMGDLINSNITRNKKNERSVTSLITLGTYPLDTVETGIQNSRIQNEVHSYYQEAETLLKEEKYEEAILAFEALGEYLDSKEKAREIKTTWNNLRYAEAIELYKAENYEQALSIFTTLDDYKDSKRYARKAKLEWYRSVYYAAKDLFKAEDYVGAKALFETISDFEDSSDYIQEAEAFILAKEQAALELSYYNEAVILKEKGDLLKAQKLFIKAGDCNDANEQFFEIWNTFKVIEMYDEAQNNLNSGEATLAYEQFTALNDYEDSIAFADKALQIIKEEQYSKAKIDQTTQPEVAYLSFMQLGDYKDSSSLATTLLPNLNKDVLYELGDTLSKAGNYEQAYHAYTTLGDYKKSETYAENMSENILHMIDYKKSIYLVKLGKTKQAKEIFDSLGNFRDSKEQSKKTNILDFTTTQLRDDVTSPVSDVFIAPDGSKHVYQIYKGVHKWVQAKAFCEVLGGHLASVTTAEENQFVHNFMLESGYLTAFFGLENEERDGNWKWANDEPFEYSNWHEGQPSKSPKERYGMYFYKHEDGTWNDSHFYEDDKVDPGCSFICEWDVE